MRRADMARSLGLGGSLGFLAVREDPIRVCALVIWPVRCQLEGPWDL